MCLLPLAWGQLSGLVGTSAPTPPALRLPALSFSPGGSAVKSP